MRKRRGAPKHADTSVGRESGRPVKTGSAQFVRELRSRTFPRYGLFMLSVTELQDTYCKVKIRPLGDSAFLTQINLALIRLEAMIHTAQLGLAVSGFIGLKKCFENAQ